MTRPTTKAPKVEVTFNGGRSYIPVPQSPESPTGFVHCKLCGGIAAAESNLYPSHCAHEWEPWSKPQTTTPSRREGR